MPDCLILGAKQAFTREVPMDDPDDPYSPDNLSWNWRFGGPKWRPFTRLSGRGPRVRSAGFYERELGLQPMAGSPPGVVAFQTSPIPFAVREPLPGTDLDAGPAGFGVLLSLRADDAQALHDQLKTHSVPILTEPFDTPFGRTFVFQDPDGYAVAIHGATEG